MIRSRAEGSALLLFPAAVLVVIVLGAIAIDFSIAFLGERELANATAAAANDVAARALDNRRFYQEGAVALDPAAAGRFAAEEVRSALDANRYHDVRVTVRVVGDGRTIVVDASARVDYLFARALPAGPEGTRVAATTTASLRSS